MTKKASSNRVDISFGSCLSAQLIRGDCLEELPKLPAACVDLVAVDLPYGVSNNKWDVPIPLDRLWEEFLRVTRPNAAFVMTATQPFASLLVMSQPKLFRYDVIWEKTICSGQLNVSRQPLRAHESVLVFSRGKAPYLEQLQEGTPYKIKRKASFEGPGYGQQRESEKINDGFRHARSVLKIGNPRIKGGHPTQKPVELMEWIVKSYSRPGTVVLDCCMGVGTTGVAAINCGRNFIGIELEKKYFDAGVERLRQCHPPP